MHIIYMGIRKHRFRDGHPLERFFRRMPGVEIVSGAFADNPASLRVLEGRGFRIIGVRDVYSKARGQMVPLVETRLGPADFAGRRQKA